MDENAHAHSYFIDEKMAIGQRRSLPVIIAARKCQACRQAETAESVVASKPLKHIKRIAEQCADTSDYLLPDTPLKEAIFRVLLAGGNEPMTADEVGEVLSTRWSMSTYPRDISSKVIGRLLEHSQSYCIAALPEPEPEPEPEPSAKEVKEDAAGEGDGGDEGG